MSSTCSPNLKTTRAPWPNSSGHSVRKRCADLKGKPSRPQSLPRRIARCSHREMRDAPHAIEEDDNGDRGRQARTVYRRLQTADCADLRHSLGQADRVEADVAVGAAG